MPHRTIQVHAEPGLWPPTWPMGLTMLRLLLLPLFLWLMLVDVGDDRGLPHPNRWWALAVFGLMAATDKLDGYLARKLQQTSRLGAFLDPLADKLLIACSVILLSFRWVAPPGYQIPIAVVLAVYGKDIIVAVGTVVLLSLIGKVTIRPRPLGKLSTVLQLALVMATLVATDLVKMDPNLGRGSIVSLWWAVGTVAIAACGDYIMQGVKQLQAAKAEQHARVGKDQSNVNPET